MDDDEQEQTSAWHDSTDEHPDDDALLQSIELDCPPGYPRPGDLIDGVLEGTGLQAGAPVAMVFGLWRWEFRMERETWVTHIQPLIQPRIIALYQSGAIRYGSW